ncbi:CDP-diacylglycerol--serine O-phosphatidyltransferase [Alicyclobacillus macrosporangiidus]|uniref:CDP-diacylglycerol--serine O-phosphatidyltransferase n=1 Tax=Alicyclobacillus macrosporangiidus TaxID=392015 RepID=UPI000496E17C|nr:CDP-diacylglycerol--serine O-phosphatidyltransferase [Alicyclobacillus macrosporangiidus]MCL6599309.1 CDP-diacylglycerol--serine O-phosphatidyltransferase [Alicyclobacillus macrosporangiidus]
MLIKMVPSLLTVGNLVLGMVALVLALQGFTADAALLVVIGMVLDGMDGRVARWLQAESAFGKELDSLSDIVTFGVAPALIMYEVVLQNEGWPGLVLATLFPVCGALRLARFNVQTKSTHYFVGLPITAAGGILSTMALYKNVLYPSDVILPLGMLVLALLMISQVRYPNFKKVAFPRSAIVMVPLLAILVCAVFRYQHSAVNRLIFIPLAVYALYGVGRMIRRRGGKFEEAPREAKLFKETK